MPPLSPLKRSCLALAIGQALAAPTQAATITVDTTLDAVANINDCTLREALTSAKNEANYSGCVRVGGSGADIIDFDLTLPAIINLGSPLQIDDTQPVTIDGPGADLLTLALATSVGRVITINDDDVTINSLTITGGSIEIYGGGIYVSQSHNVTLSHVTISGNTAGTVGGGIFVQGSNNLTLSNSTVTGNSAGEDGGAIHFLHSDAATIENSTISGNSADDHGGGLYVWNSENLTITSSTLSGNSAANRAGGVAVYQSDFLAIENSTVSGNFAGIEGGGVHVLVSESFSMTNSTVTGNSATNTGGGIFNYSLDTIMDLANTIVSGNRAGSENEIYATSVTAVLDQNNLFGDAGESNGAAFFGIAPGASDITATSDGTAPTALSAILEPALADNGGPTLTHALVSGSPAIDAADNASCPATDQRGEERDPDCDIGAFEFIDDGICFVVSGADGRSVVFCL